MKIIMTLMLLASTANACAVTFDAAEVDLNGDPLPAAAIRIIVDNTQCETDADITWDDSSTDIASGRTIIAPDDPDNPWYIADLPPLTWYEDGEQWSQGLQYNAGEGWYKPVLVHNPTPEIDDEEHPELYDTIEYKGVIPAGRKWDVTWWISDEAARLFHSPASSNVTVNGESQTLLDFDRGPQTAVPEPATMALLAMGGLVVLRRRGLARPSRGGHRRAPGREGEAVM